MKTERITKKQAARAARAKLPILGDKKLQAELDWALGECPRCSPALALAEAYRLGAETAQRVIAARIEAIGRSRAAASTGPPQRDPESPLP